MQIATPLGAAAEAGHVSVVSLLLSRKASVEKASHVSASGASFLSAFVSQFKEDSSE